jgi:hypothetical protein
MQSGKRHLPSLLNLDWPRSELFTACLALVLGTLYAWGLVGSAIIDPSNVTWVSGDPALYYIAWGEFRQDPSVNWPLTFTTRLGFPIGQSIALLDPIPLWAMLLKPFSRLLPPTFQYFGLYAIVTFALQFYFAAKLFLLLIGRNFLSVLLPSLFFLTAPPATMRMGYHFGLVSQWLIIAAIYLYFKHNSVQILDIRSYVAQTVGLTVLSLTINPYLAIMTAATLVSSVVSLLLQRRIKYVQAVLVVVGIGLSAVISAWALGLMSMGQADYGASGFRYFSFNLLSPLDPNIFGAVFMKGLPRVGSGQYEGYAYLGAGAILLWIAVLPALAQNFAACKIRLTGTSPLLVCCGALTIIAISTQITAADRVLLDVDPREALTRYFSVIRASGRMVWVCFYVSGALLFYFAFCAWRRSIAVAVVAVTFVIQYVDLSPLRSAVRLAVNGNSRWPLISSAWNSLGAEYKHLVVLPAKQCNEDGPGGPEGYRTFGLLAVSQHLTINSYHAGRYDSASLKYHCEDVIKTIAYRGLAKDSVYVVSPQVARLIASSPSGPDKCRQLDGFIVCADRPLDLPRYTPEHPAVDSSGIIDIRKGESARRYLMGGWHAIEPDLVWSNGRGVIEFRLSQGPATYRSIRLNVIALVGGEDMAYRVEYGKETLTGRIPGGANRLESFPIMLPFNQTPTGEHVIRLITVNPSSPSAMQISADPRVLGLGLRSVEFVK